MMQRNASGSRNLLRAARLEWRKDVKAPSFGDFVQSLKAWWATMPRKRYLIGGVALFVIGLLVRSLDLTKLQSLCDQIVADLGLIQPFSLLGIYFHNLVACDHTSTIYGEIANCSPWRFLNPVRLIGSLLKTIAQVWSQSAGPGFILLPLALIATYPIAASMVMSLSKRMFDSSEFNLIHGLLAAPLTPFILSVIALVFQILAIALFFIFGKIVGLGIWIGALVKGILEVWKFFKNVRKHAETLEAVEQMIKSKFTSDPADHKKPQ
jgi:hypothetical protein